jgi:hypothetical protein
LSLYGWRGIVKLLNEYRASWAILRQWAGYDAAVAEREKQIKKLQNLVWNAIYALQKAAKLRRAVAKALAKARVSTGEVLPEKEKKEASLTNRKRGRIWLSGLDSNQQLFAVKTEGSARFPLWAQDNGYMSVSGAYI